MKKTKPQKMLHINTLSFCAESHRETVFENQIQQYLKKIWLCVPNYFNKDQVKKTLTFFLSFFLQSWWIWADSEISDLWYNCFHDNATKTWLCAASNESGKSASWPAFGFFFVKWRYGEFSHRCLKAFFVFTCASVSCPCSLPRLAAVCPGPHGPLRGLLLHLLPGVCGPAGHHVRGRTLLLHGPLPGLCRCFECLFLNPHETAQTWWHFMLLLIHSFEKILVTSSLLYHHGWMHSM